MIQQREEMTEREREQHEHEKAMFDRQAEHTQKVRAMELEAVKLESKWSSWLKLPLVAVKLPLYVVLGVAYCIAAARKHDPPEEFWKLLK